MAERDGGVRGARRFRFVVAEEERDERLDQLVARHVPELSRGAARTLLALGGVYVDRHRVKIASRRLRAGQTVDAWVGGALERARGGKSGRPAGGATGRTAAGAGAGAGAGPPMPRVVFHDAHLAVLDKPAGLLTAPTPEGDRGSLVDLVERELLPGARAFVVHRLDRMTSGLLVVARSALANRKLSACFRTHDVEREYLAVARGVLAASMAIEAPIGGRRALTHVAIEERLGDAATLVRARLETGRTHQIRIHLAGIGHPVLGDREHGATAERDGAAPPPAPSRMALHATVLGFAHPATGERLRFESPWPSDLEAWLERLRSDAHASVGAVSALRS